MAYYPINRPEQMTGSVKIMESDLVAGCMEENRSAQKALYEFFYPKMMGVCMRYASDRDEAADILNNAFFKVFRNINRYDPAKGVLESWIRRIVINTAIDFYRKEIRRKVTSLPEHYVVADDSSSPVDTLCYEDLIKLVQSLSPGYRTVFSLYVIEGYPHKEIAEKLGISEGTSKSNLAKARIKLQKMVASIANTKIKSHVQ